MANSVAVNFSGSSQTVLAAPTGPFSYIAVTGIDLIVAGATNVTIQDTAGNNYTGPWPLAANDGLVKEAPAGDYLYVLPKGAGLVITNSGSVQVSGSVQYYIVMP